MRNLSNDWDLLFTKDDVRLDTRAVINGIEYTAITAPVIHHNLLSSDTLTVGNCVSASLTFTVKTANVIPKSAKVVIKCRLVDGSSATSWYEFGTFWVSKRTVDDEYVTLECYDAMLKGNQVYGGSSDAMNWPKPMQTVLGTIASRMGVALDSRTSIRSDSTTYKCEYPGDMTLLEVLGHIGACNGGNWIITPENKLRLVPLGGSGDTLNVSVVLSQITTANSYTVSGVTMVLDEEHVYSCGNDSGYVLTINPCPYACQTIADNLYNSLRGLVYQPFSISGAIYNPKAELGDAIRIGNIQSMLMAETLTFDISFRADAEAPGKDEMEDEYPYPSEILRLQQSTVELKRNDERLRTSIEQTQSRVSIIAENYVGKNSVRSAFALDHSNIVLEAGVDEDGKPTGTITMKAGTLIVEGDNFSLDKNGNLKCTGAELNGGTLYNERKSGESLISWLKVEGGRISGGETKNYEKGYISFENTTDVDAGGVTISGKGYVFLDAPSLLVARGYGYATGQNVNYGTLNFVNGILTDTDYGGTGYNGTFTIESEVNGLHYTYDLVFKNGMLLL